MKVSFHKLCIFLMLTFSSCSLDETIIDSYTATSIKTENDVTAVIHGVYSPLNDSELFKFRMLLMLFLQADDFYSLSGGDFQAFTANSIETNRTLMVWNGFYSIIGNANNLIDVLNKKEFDPDFEKRAYGEAYFLRAFSYYYLVRLYGGVPLRTETVNENANFYQVRSTIDETYEQIFKDFKVASELLPLRTNINSAELGRVTKGAAQGLLSQAYLTFANYLARNAKPDVALKNYQLAVNYADSVITSNQYELLQDYGDLWDVKNEINAYREVLFGIRFSADPTKLGVKSSGSEFAYYFLHGRSWGMTGNIPNRNGNGSFFIQPWVADFYTSGDYGAGSPVYGADNFDYRAEITYGTKSTAGVSNTVTGINSRDFYFYPFSPPIPSDDPIHGGFGTIVRPICQKYVDGDGKDYKNHGNDFFIMRYAEIFLIKAEALNEIKGPNQESIDLINVVRQRAKNADGVERSYPKLLSLATLNQISLRMKIFEERGAEFLGEAGMRRFDLIRMQSPVDPLKSMYDYQFTSVLPTLPVQQPNYRQNQNNYNRRGGIDPESIATLNYDPKFNLFPIPLTELLSNPNFGPQNPGW